MNKYHLGLLFLSISILGLLVSSFVIVLLQSRAVSERNKTPTSVVPHGSFPPNFFNPTPTNRFPSPSSSSITTPTSAPLQPSKTFQRDTWMKDLSPWISNKPFYEITMPGSHDTMTYRCLSQAKTQDKNVAESLLFGIRYFDIRLVFDPLTGKWKGHHNEIPCGSDWEDVCHQILDFFQDAQHHQEIVFLKLRLSPTGQTNISPNLLGPLQSKILLPTVWSVPFSSLKERGNLFISVDEEYVSRMNGLCLSNAIVWDPYNAKHDLKTPQNLTDELRDIYSQSTPPSSGNLTVLQWISTGYKTEIVFHPHYILEHAHELNQFLIDNIGKPSFPSPPRTRASWNVIMVDKFEDPDDTTRAIIRQNTL